MDTITSWLEQALRFHRGGHLEAAKPLYQRILQVQPSHQAAHFLLGSLHASQGDALTAVRHLQQAVALQPNHTDAHLNLGNALQALGRWSEAEESFRRAIRLRPNQPEAHYNLANLFHAQGRLSDAEQSYREALRVKPNFVAACYNLGVILQELQRPKEAERSFRKAIRLCPDLTIAYANLGAALQAQGKREEAVECFRQVLRREPNSSTAHYNLACSLAEMGAIEEAVASYRTAISLNPDFTEAHYNLGNLLLSAGKLDEAAAAFRCAIALAPSHSDAHNNLGVVLQRQGRFQEALECFRQAIRHQAENAEAHWNLAATLLLLGRLPEAWPEFEWRIHTRALAPRHFTQPRWSGSHTADTVLVYAEQGFGDTIQFVRYLSLVKERVGRVIFECQPELATLLQGCDGIDAFVIQSRDGLPPAVSFQHQISLMSLPGVFGTAPDTIPHEVPYIHVPPAVRARWRERLAGVNGFKVGIVWSGNPLNANNHNRSCRLTELASLADVEGLALFSLQKGEAAEEITSTPHGLRLTPLGDELADFADTAAVILELDLVISVDTAVAHLAGALGQPVWTLLSFIPDWRWMMDRSDSPWYPTMRLFRQPAPGDWGAVFKKVAQELKQHISSQPT